MKLQALEFRNWIGGEAKINEYCHSTALEGGKRLAEVLGTRLLNPEGDLTANMVRPFVSSFVLVITHFYRSMWSFPFLLILNTLKSLRWKSPSNL
jgi:hypothetical protein